MVGTKEVSCLRAAISPCTLASSCAFSYSAEGLPAPAIDAMSGAAATVAVACSAATFDRQ